jgi:hypothetical protein
VTGNDDGDGILIVRHTDGPEGLRRADRGSDVSVGARFAVRDVQKRGPDRLLERRTFMLLKA